MWLSAPVYRLKREAKLLARQESIPLHEALNRIAEREGFTSWSLLVSKAPAVTPAIPAAKLFAELSPGDLLLLGARPRQGKTLMSLALAAEAMKSGQRAAFFTLEYTERDVLDRFSALGLDYVKFAGLFTFDSSDDISAAYIEKKLAAAPRGTLAVVDYLQLLDQKREKPHVMEQVRSLQVFARKRGLVFVFISQIDRSYDSAAKPCPDLGDVRMPNPLDLKLFSKTCFLNGGEVQFGAVR